jgi:5-methyltetrahydrofolate--homocysteine methyltransferase
LEFKPDMPEAARHWDAFFARELINRPLVCVTAPLPGKPDTPVRGYRERVFGDMDEAILAQVEAARYTYFGGDAVPAAWISFGPDEVAVFCGAELAWSDDSGDTNWSVACIENWEAALPIRLRDDHPLYRRLLAMYRRAAELAGGKLLFTAPDLHTNMDLLAAMRGPQRLCLDLLDCPETVDRAMADARAVFPRLWDDIWEAGRIAELGATPSTTLQCDFSCMVSPAMFRRWILPALEEEAAIVGNVVYHWDGPDAVVHTLDLLAGRGLHGLAYVPGAGRGGHADYVDLFRRVQAGGKAVSVWGSADEVKAMHRDLKPELTAYHTWAATPQEADKLLEWFVANT